MAFEHHRVVLVQNATTSYSTPAVINVIATSSSTAAFEHFRFHLLTQILILTVAPMIPSRNKNMMQFMHGIVEYIRLCKSKSQSSIEGCLLLSGPGISPIAM